MITLTQIVFRLLLSAALSGLIGFERETRHRPAGLRTIILIGMGTTMVMIVSLNFAYDPSRLVAGILTPIGLLGTGVIIHGRDKNETQGITTAATIFMVSGIGLAVGLGLYLPAIFASMLTLVILYALDSNKVKSYFGD